MAGSAFTPGPWVSRTEPTMVAINTLDGTEIAGVWVRTWNFDKPQYGLNETVEANARLIAAAPEMLEALRYADKDFEAMGYGADHSVRKHILSAITKAEGK